MKYYLLSDNVDTQTGMALAGIEGRIVHTPEELRLAIENVCADDSVAILLITEKLLPLCPELIYSIKLKQRRPLIVEVPDRHGSGKGADSIARYVRDAIGVKV